MWMIALTEEEIDMIDFALLELEFKLRDDWTMKKELNKLQDLRKKVQDIIAETEEE